jgi:predicted porin
LSKPRFKDKETRTMKRTSIALAIGLSLAAAAQAQSTVTVYGKLDAGLRKAPGSSVKEVATSGDSRLGFRGVEDLGGGNRAFFQLEHRFFPDTGAVDGSQFWKGISVVGLSGSFGRIGVGRQYTAAFSLAQNVIDPFGGDTVAQLRDGVSRVGGITRVRIDGSLRYDISLGGLSLAASIAESDKNIGPKRPVSAAAQYRSGPWMLAAGYENPAGVRDEQWNLGLGYTLGGTQLTAGLADGKTSTGVTARGWLLGASMQVGAGSFKAAYGETELGGAKLIRKLGLGYHYSLSKRTMLYADLGHDTKLRTSRTGYDFGVLHNF